MFGVIKFLDKEFSKTFELQVLASLIQIHLRKKQPGECKTNHKPNKIVSWKNSKLLFIYLFWVAAFLVPAFPFMLEISILAKVSIQKC